MKPAFVLITVAALLIARVADASADDLALFAARQYPTGDPELWLGLLEDPRPQRPAHQVWVRAMRHALASHAERSQDETRTAEAAHSAPEHAPTVLRPQPATTWMDWDED